MLRLEIWLKYLILEILIPDNPGVLQLWILTGKVFICFIYIQQMCKLLNVYECSCLKTWMVTFENNIYHILLIIKKISENNWHTFKSCGEPFYKKLMPQLVMLHLEWKLNFFDIISSQRTNCGKSFKWHYLITCSRRTNLEKFLSLT